MKYYLKAMMLIVTAVLLPLLLFCGGEKTEQEAEPHQEMESLTDMSHLFPEKYKAWLAVGEFEKYDRDGIFTYIDGAGEVFRMYDYRQVWVRRYSKPDMPEITVEIFDMGKAEDAFGIFMHSREGVELGVGQGSDLRGGIISFWKGRYFVSLSPTETSAEVEKAMTALAVLISGRIEETGQVPEIVSYLPQPNRIANTLKFFHLHTSLNYHYYLSPDNILNLYEDTDAALAEYLPGGVYLMCVRYPIIEDAATALVNFRREFLKTEGEENIVEIDNDVWVGVSQNGLYLILVFDAQTMQQAADLMIQVETNLDRK